MATDDKAQQTVRDMSMRDATIPRFSLPTSAQSEEVARGLPGLFRVAVTSSWRAFTWAVGSTVTTGREVVQRTLSGEPVQLVLHDTTNELRLAAARALGVEPQRGPDGHAVESSNPMTRAASTFFAPLPAQRAMRIEDNSSEALYARGQQLLRQSADVFVAEEGHPAYARILSELTPDEARILRFLYKEGPQPSIDVRTNRPFGIGSELVAAGLSMIAEHAGLRHLDRIHPYLTNLFRLGLLEFSKEQVENPNRYQLIEAQPNMLEAMERAGFAPKTVRRSIHLNSFGEDFCKTCLFGEGARENGQSGNT